MEVSEAFSNPSLQHIVVTIFLLTAVRVLLRRTYAAVSRYVGMMVESLTLALGLVFLLLRPFVVQSYFITDPSMRPTLERGDFLLVNKIQYRIAPPRRGEAVVFRANDSGDAGPTEIVKRLVALPGDTVEIRPGSISVGDKIFRNTGIRQVLGIALPSRNESATDLPPLRLASDAIWVGNQPISPREFARRAGLPETLPVRLQPGMVLRNGKPLIEDYVSEDPEYLVPPRRIPSGRCFVLGDNRNQSHDSHRGEEIRLTNIVGRAELVFWPPQRVHFLP